MELLFGLFQIIPLLVIALIVFAVASVAGRREPDPTGRRPYGVYLAIVAFIALFVLLFSSTFAVAALAEIINDPEFAERGGAVLSGLIALAAALVLLFHTRRQRALAAEPNAEPRSTYQVYLYAVCLLTILTALVTAALTVFALVRLVFPGAVGNGGEGGSVPLITTAYLTVVASAIFLAHWRRAAAFRTPPPDEPRPEAAPPV